MLSRARLSFRQPGRRLPGIHRHYVASTAARSSSALAYAEAPSDDPPPLPASSSSGSLATNLSAQRDDLLRLPTPLPGDAPFETRDQELYPSANIVNATSMIAICLRRKDTVPRAYQVFSKQLELAEAGKSLWPDSTIWGKMVEGLASIGSAEQTSILHKWHQRAEMMVDKWNNVSASRLSRKWRPSEAVLDNGGIQVYTGLLYGLFKSKQPLEALLPYFQASQLPLMDLMEGIPASDHPAVFAILRDLAKEYGLSQMEKDVDWLEAFEAEQREAHAREYIPPANPVSTHPREQGIAHGDPALAEPRFAIANFRESLASINTPALPIQRQLNLETASLTAARTALEHANEQWSKMDHVMGDANLGTTALQANMYEWSQALAKQLRKTIAGLKFVDSIDSEDIKEEIRAGPLPREQRSRVWSSVVDMQDESLYPYLSLFTADKLALVTILELMRSLGTPSDLEGVRVIRAASGVGRAIEAEYRADTIREVTGTESFEWKRILDKQSGKPARDRIMSSWRQIGENIDSVGGNWAGVWTPPWTEYIHISLGSWLLKQLTETALVSRSKKLPDGETVEEVQPAFSHLYEYVRGKKIGLIRANPSIAKRIGIDDLRGVPEPRGVPMLVEPKPWVGINDGGYLELESVIMRFKEHSPEQYHYLAQAIRQKNMEPVLHGLDVLSTTPWKINRAVFDVVLEAWNNGGEIAAIPPSEFKANYKRAPEPDPNETDPRVRLRWAAMNREISLQQRKDHGERCNLNYKLEVARSFLNETFYIPHNMDFRGRAYPIPPYLAPVGDDLSRGLLLFADKKPLGKTGLYWLQVQVANLRGDDKASFEGRVQFAKDHVAEIHDSADHPLDGKRWWLDAEDPWQCLAACMELSRALRSEDPEKFESSLPIHQDGTCNGMQHYAALGGDVLGAKAVNLQAGDRPADIYTAVLDLVNKVVEDDRQNGVPLAQHFTKPLGRKVVKQTVMTTVYGVTFIGARDQIARQLKDKEIVAPEFISSVAGYLAKTVMACIGDLFSGAKDIMDFLTASARIISRSVPRDRCLEMSEKFDQKITRSKTLRRKTPAVAKVDLLNKELMSSVIWTTPLGMPVVQPYRKTIKKQILTALQSVYIADASTPAQVNPSKQSSAFPPNYIHSLDATHMLLTSLQCRDKHITFAAVHDSYWTHASTVEDMSDLIRDSFIELHSQDLIGNLREEFVARYGDHLIPFVTASQRASGMAQLMGKSSISRSLDAAKEDRTSDSVEALEKPAESAKTGSDGGKVAVGDSAALSSSETKVQMPTFEQIGGMDFVRVVDLLPPTPKRGTFDVRNVKQSRYFFS